MNKVVDVRSAPYSGYAPHFNHDFLQDALENEGVSYLFMGGELGGRPVNRSCYRPDGRVLHDKIAKTDWFNDGLSGVSLWEGSILVGKRVVLGDYGLQKAPRRAKFHLAPLADR